jgi:hypothetical protein
MAIAGRPQLGLVRSRLGLAAKTALAAGLAWAVAPLIPGPAAHYPYYAPLGAVVSMYPTVADSARHGLQSLLGLGLGVGVALVVANFTDASALAVALVVGLGVLIGGLPKMGAASDWVPIAALFVLVIGGQSADSFSLAYVLQMAIGVVIGFAVNWTVLPPLHFAAVTSAFANQREALARQLDDMATAMTEAWPPDHRDWADRDTHLARTAMDVRRAVHRAEESARANPRRRRHPRNLGEDLKDLRAIERVTFQVQDITDVLSSAIWEERAGTSVPSDLTEHLAEALEATATLLQGWDDGDGLPELLERAHSAVDGVSAALRAAASREASVNATASVAMSLRRIIGIVSRRAGGGR